MGKLRTRRGMCEVGDIWLRVRVARRFGESHHTDINVDYIDL